MEKVQDKEAAAPSYGEIFHQLADAQEVWWGWESSFGAGCRAVLGSIKPKWQMRQGGEEKGIGREGILREHLHRRVINLI